MRKFKKILIDRSNKITKIKENKNFKKFADEMGGYNSNEHYKSKESFFRFYLNDRYKIWDNYLKKNLNPNSKTLTLASGRGINELSLIADNFDITCSDIEIPACYEESKKLFGNFDYLNFNILNSKINKQFDSIYSVSAFYIFSHYELEKIFKNISEVLKKDGILIIDFGGCEDNLISYFLHEIYLVFEAYIIYFLFKPFNKKIGFKFDYNFGYRWKNSEIIKLANKFGYNFVSFEEYDYLTELKRSVLIRKIIEYCPSTKKFFSFIGKKIPYIRMFKFKKI